MCCQQKVHVLLLAGKGPRWLLVDYSTVQCAVCHPCCQQTSWNNLLLHASLFQLTDAERELGAEIIGAGLLIAAVGGESRRRTSPSDGCKRRQR
jgi:hypothetical protein